MTRAKEWILEQIKGIEDTATKEYLQLLESLHEKRHWHQLTLALEEFIRTPFCQQGKFLLELYDNFIVDFQTKLNFLTLAQTCIVISNQHTEPQAAIDYLEKIIQVVKSNDQAHVLLKCTVGLLNLKLNNLEVVKQILDESKTILTSLTGVEASVNASFYLLSSSYNEIQGNATEYYNEMLLYLAYIPPNSISIENQLNIAYKLAVSSLVGENVFSYSELLSHPVFASLETTSNAWISQLVKSFNVGDKNQFLKISDENSTNFNKIFGDKTQILNEKITILALMENVFRLSSDDRVLTFNQVATIAQIPEAEVEFLLMKALSLNLIKGIIDEVEQKVYIRWVLPRILEMSQLSTMSKKLAEWQEKVEKMHKFISAESPELLSG